MRSLLQQSLDSGGMTLTAEVMPPRGGDPSHSLAMAEKLRGRVHAINITDSSRAVMRMSSLAMCKLLQERGIEPVFQLACRDRNRIGLQSDLLGASALGLKNVLCLTGDPVRVGDQPEAKPVNEYDSIKLLKLISELNSGQDPVSGSLADGATNLFPGASADPNCKSLNGLRRRLERKKEAGAEFFQTQMVMDAKILEKFCEEVANPLNIKVLAGVFLLKSAKNAQFINKVVPGASIPDSIIARLESADDPAKEGIAIASEQVKRYLGITQGIHLMAIKAEDKIIEILDKANINLPQ